MRICKICGGRDCAERFPRLVDWEYGVEGQFSFEVCQDCGVYRLDPMPRLDELKDYYPEDYHGFHTTNNGIISFLYKIVNKIRFGLYKKFLGKGGALLDVGCADAGYFDSLAREVPDAHLCGVEFKDEIAQRGRSKGRNIVTGTIEDSPEHRKFNLIIMNNLIEHVVDPISELKKAHDLLVPDGHVMLETPNVASWDQRLFKRHWGGYHIPRHTFLFSPASMRRLVSEAGFKIEKINFLINTDHWALSLQNYLQSKAATATKVVKGRCWYYKYLLFLFIPVSIVQKAFKRSGAMSAIIKKSGEQT